MRFMRETLRRTYPGSHTPIRISIPLTHSSLLMLSLLTILIAVQAMIMDIYAPRKIGDTQGNRTTRHSILATCNLKFMASMLEFGRRWKARWEHISLLPKSQKIHSSSVVVVRLIRLDNSWRLEVISSSLNTSSQLPWWSIRCTDKISGSTRLSASGLNTKVILTGRLNLMLSISMSLSNSPV